MLRGFVSWLVISVAIAGCATKPRQFVPTTLADDSATEAFRADFAACAEQAHAQVPGKRGVRTQAAVGGAAAGAGAAVGVSAASATIAASTMVAGASTSAAAVTAIVLAPVALGAVAGVGVARYAIRSSKEKKLKVSMQQCMTEHGHTVEGWKRAAK